MMILRFTYWIESNKFLIEPKKGFAAKIDWLKDVMKNKVLGLSLFTVAKVL